MTLERILAETTQLLERAKVGGASIERVRFLRQEIARLGLEVDRVSTTVTAGCGHAVCADFSDVATKGERRRIRHRLAQQRCLACMEHSEARRVVERVRQHVARRLHRATVQTARRS